MNWGSRNTTNDDRFIVWLSDTDTSWWRNGKPPPSDSNNVVFITRSLRDLFEYYFFARKEKLTDEYKKILYFLHIYGSDLNWSIDYLENIKALRFFYQKLEKLEEEELCK